MADQENLKERYGKAMPLLAELLHMRKVFTSEVVLVDAAGKINAKALGYICGLTVRSSDCEGRHWKRI